MGITVKPRPRRWRLLLPLLPLLPLVPLLPLYFVTLMPTHCGTIALAGSPNAGKSSLLNALVGEPLAIVSHKPQSTRQPVVGIRTDSTAQLIFVDPPGLLEPEYLLHHRMIDQALMALRQADGVLYLHPADQGPPPPLDRLVPGAIRPGQPCRTVLTKADLRPSGNSAVADSAPLLAVSVLTGQGIDELLAWCRSVIPEGPFRFDPEQTSSQPVRFFVAEYLRETAFELLADEVPYAIAVEVDEFRESTDPVYIRLTILVERESQKRIVVGRSGATIKALGSATRAKVETLLGQRVYLDLWVKTLPRWRTREDALRRLGFPVPSPR